MSSISGVQFARQAANEQVVTGVPIVFSFASNDFIDAIGTISYTAMLEGGAPLPGWLSFNPVTRTFTASDKSTTGLIDVVIVATGSDGSTASQDFQVNVQPARAALQTQAPDQRFSGGQAFSFALPAGSFTGGTLTYRATLSGGAALPAWLSFNPATGTFAGKAPATSVVETVLVTATNSTGSQASETFNISVSPAVPVLVHQEGNQQFIGGHAISISLPIGSMSDPSGGVITYKASLTGGTALPAWLSFNAATGLFTGTAPIKASNTTIVVTGVSSNGGSNSESFQLRSTDAPPVLAHPTGTVQLTGGAAFSVDLTTAFADAAGEKLTFKAMQANGSALPSWLVFNTATTVLSGTAPIAAGSQKVVVMATDAIGQSVLESFSIVTAAAAAAPVVMATAAAAAPVVESDYLQTHRFFASTSLWNTPIVAGGKTSAVAGLSNYLAGLTTWTTGGGNVAIYYAHATDPLVAVYYNPYSWYEVVTGVWKQTHNTAASEQQITSTLSATNPVPGNPYSTQNASLLWNSPVSGLPAHYNAWHQAAGQVLYMHVPVGAVPTASSDGQTVVIQPDGTAVEMYAPIVLSSGAWVSEMFSTTDAVNGTGTGADNGRTASMIENYAGALRDTDISSGVIDHALALAIPASLLKAAFVGPALTFDASPNYSGTLAMGSHLALAPGTTAAGLGLLSTFGKEVATAASTYGMFVVDRGGSGVSIVTQNNPSSAVLKSYGSAEQMDLNSILHHLVLLAN